MRVDRTNQLKGTRIDTLRIHDTCRSAILCRTESRIILSFTAQTVNIYLLYLVQVYLNVLAIFQIPLGRIDLLVYCSYFGNMDIL